MKYNTIFFIGPQGSGKGTQAKILANSLGFFHWDNGAICRAAALQDTDLGRKVKNMVDNGIYLDDQTLMEVAQDKLNSIPVTTGIIFDGLPRRLSQAQFLIPFLQKQGRQNFATVFLDIPKEESLSRLLKRAEIEHRTDDTPEKIEKRLQQYYDETLPILDYMKQHGQFFQIDGRPPIEEVSKEIQERLKM
jgi:adenylate kinase